MGNSCAAAVSRSTGSRTGIVAVSSAAAAAAHVTTAASTTAFVRVRTTCGSTASSRTARKRRPVASISGVADTTGSAISP